MSDPTTDDGSISQSARWWLWGGGWGLAAVLTAIHSPAHLLLVPFFPVGLLALLPNGEQAAIGGWMLQFPIMLGWAFYAAYSFIMLRQRRATVFFVLYIVFCIVLVLNVGGCQRTMDAASKIE